MLNWKVLFIIFKGPSVTRNCLRPQSLPLRVCFFKKSLNRSSHHRCSVKKVFLEIWRNSQENTCARVSFWITLQASSPSSRHSDVFLKFDYLPKKVSDLTLYGMLLLMFYWNITKIFRFVAAKKRLLQACVLQSWKMRKPTTKCE